MLFLFIRNSNTLKIKIRKSTSSTFFRKTLLFMMIGIEIFAFPFQSAAIKPIEFEKSNREMIKGWMLLNPNPSAVRKSIEKAAKYGANHIQFSNGIIMNVEDILGENEQNKSRVKVLNMGIKLAHEYGMKTYFWAHEFSGLDKSKNPVTICYGPDSEIWKKRKEAYRIGIAKIPEIDGVILMFGSAPTPPWETVCTCTWCSTRYSSNENVIPPQDERIQMVVEHIGGYITNELGKELFIRTFVHAPEEVEWHNKGLANANGVKFTGMHKGPIQDWQPYNPHHPSIGQIGDHPCIMELDIAGEYYGRSVLPFCSPGYYRYRLNNLWQHRGIGVVMRIEHRALTALGTPNEINAFAITQLLQNPSKSLEKIWDDFIFKTYNLVPGGDGHKILKKILKDTFPIRCKSQYVLGIWAHDKSSNYPKSAQLSQFHNRGKMPRWDSDWKNVWNMLDRPDNQTVIRIWQEGSEAVELAKKSLKAVSKLENKLSQKAYSDISLRIMHQKYDAEVWRAIDLFVWAQKASLEFSEDTARQAWMRWAYEELVRIKSAMESDRLDNVKHATPTDITSFLESVSSNVNRNIEPLRPNTLLFSPIETVSVQKNSAEIRFQVNKNVKITIDYGFDIPDYGKKLDIGIVQKNTLKTVKLINLVPNERYVVRLQSTLDNKQYFGGDFWIFTPLN